VTLRQAWSALVPILSTRGALGGTIPWAARLYASAVIDLALSAPVGQGASCKTTGNRPNYASLGQVMPREPTDNCTLDTALCLGCANTTEYDDRHRRRSSHDPHDAPNLCPD
jgi:hypothetical protein